MDFYASAMKPHTFTIKVNPHSTLRVRVRVHASSKALVTARGEDCAAFCNTYAQPDSEGCIAEVHFNRKELTIGFVAHESLHAAIAFVRLWRADLTSTDAEEMLADTVEYLTDGITCYLKAQGWIKIKRLRKEAA